MDRVNSEGILRHQLAIALKDRRQVMEARKADVCEICYSALEGEELRLAGQWLSGVAQ